MPFALIIVGAVMLTAGVRGTTDQLYTLVKSDFTNTSGQKSYTYWMVSILIVGSIGYVEELRPVSRAFLVLLIVVLFLTNGGFFQKFNLQAFSPASVQPALSSQLQPNTLQTEQPTLSTVIPFVGE